MAVGHSQACRRRTKAREAAPFTLFVHRDHATLFSASPPSARRNDARNVTDLGFKGVFFFFSGEKIKHFRGRLSEYGQFQG